MQRLTTAPNPTSSKIATSAPLAQRELDILEAKRKEGFPPRVIDFCKALLEDGSFKIAVSPKDNPIRLSVKSDYKGIDNLVDPGKTLNVAHESYTLTVARYGEITYGVMYKPIVNGQVIDQLRQTSLQDSSQIADPRLKKYFQEKVRPLIVNHLEAKSSPTLPPARDKLFKAADTKNASPKKVNIGAVPPSQRGI